jgi:hypothetical protein
MMRCAAQRDLKNWEDDPDDKDVILSRFTHKQGALGGLWRWLGLGLGRSDSYMEIQAHPFVQLVCQWGDLCIPFVAAQQKKVKDGTPNLSKLHLLHGDPLLNAAHLIQEEIQLRSSEMSGAIGFKLSHDDDLDTFSPDLRKVIVDSLAGVMTLFDPDVQSIREIKAALAKRSAEKPMFFAPGNAIIMAAAPRAVQDKTPKIWANAALALINLPWAQVDKAGSLGYRTKDGTGVRRPRRHVHAMRLARGR